MNSNTTLCGSGVIHTYRFNGKLLKSGGVPGFLQKVEAELQKKKPR